MRQTENFKLSLFDGSDPVSMAAMNANTEAIDAALQAQAKKVEDDKKSNAEQFGLRAKIATGSYAGTTATASPEKFYDDRSKVFTQNFGAAVSSDKDITIALGFVPKEFHVSAFRSAYVSWSGTVSLYDSSNDYSYYESFSLTGYEQQAVELTAHYGSELVVAQYFRRCPLSYEVHNAGKTFTFASTTAASLEQSYLSSGPAAPYPFMTRVTFTENDDGTCTVTIHGTDSARATENYLDIEGMTYHWTAIG